MLKAVLRYVYWNMGARTLYFTLRKAITGSQMDLTVAETSVTMSVSDYPEFERFYDLKGERRVLANVLDEISSGDVFYDIGANVGLYSCFIGSKCPTCDVFLFEPHPTNVEASKRNLQLNGIGGTIFQLALSNHEGTAELSSEGNEAGLGEHSLDSESSDATFPVSVRKLDDLRNEKEIPVPNVVKIDVEGAELTVIEGAINTLSSPQCETVYCEVHPDRIGAFDGNYDRLREILTSIGYDIHIIDSSLGNRIMVKATK